MIPPSIIEHKENAVKRREQSKPTKEKMSTIEIGQIYYSSWGWEQTYVDFYQVTSIKNSMVGLRPIGSKMVDHDSWASGKVIALKDSFKGEEFFKRANFSLGKPSFKFTSLYPTSTAYLWDEKPKYCSWGY